MKKGGKKKNLKQLGWMIESGGRRRLKEVHIPHPIILGMIE
jgi:hypothetical protein